MPRRLRVPRRILVDSNAMRTRLSIALLLSCLLLPSSAGSEPPAPLAPSFFEMVYVASPAGELLLRFEESEKKVIARRVDRTVVCEIRRLPHVGTREVEFQISSPDSLEPPLRFVGSVTGEVRLETPSGEARYSIFVSERETLVSNVDGEMLGRLTLPKPEEPGAPKLWVMSGRERFRVDETDDQTGVRVLDALGHELYRMESPEAARIAGFLAMKAVPEAIRTACAYLLR